MAMWKKRLYPRRDPVSTQKAVEDRLVVTSAGAIECAEMTAENAAAALGRLAEALEEKGVFSANEIQSIFELYSYEETDQ